jgi:uncharacterized protein (TIGR02246 family)
MLHIRANRRPYESIVAYALVPTLDPLKRDRQAKPPAPPNPPFQLPKTSKLQTSALAPMFRCLIVICWTPLLFAQADEVRAMLARSEAVWNRGDLEAFVQDYEDAPETTFIGNEVVRGGTAAILERYRRRYPNREAMGTLTFSEIETRLLAPGLALATGKYDLRRTPAGGGDASGRFTLVVRKTAAGWKIIHDHSS